MTTIELAGTIGASFGGVAAAVWFAVRTLGGILVSQIERHETEIQRLNTWQAVAAEKLERQAKDIDAAHEKVRDLDKRMEII